MSITEPFLLPKDTILCPVNSLPQAQQQFEGEQDNIVLTRVHGRSQSKIIDPDTARLLEQFRQGRGIVDAVVAFCEESGGDPEATLEAVYPVLCGLIESGFLLPENSEEATAVSLSLRQGDDWDGWTVLRVVQLLDDSEIYQVRGGDGRLAALKIARPAAAQKLARRLVREAEILQHLGGKLAPEFIASGTFRQQDYLLSEWCEGVSGTRFAARLRPIPGRAGRRKLLDLCIAVAQAYADLHQKSVLHGDIHAGNLIIAETGEVKIIDFGLSRLAQADTTDSSWDERGGLGYFFEPEYAGAWASGSRQPPPATFAGEQHIVAHLLYRLITGYGFCEFSPEKARGMAQLAESEPEPFSRWGAAPWPQLEHALRRALAREPQARFASIAALVDALRRCEIPQSVVPAPAQPRPVTSPFSQQLLDQYLHSFDPEHALFEAPFPQVPRCSLFFGSAGVAWFLYRLACIREDATLLAWAKLWIEKAIAEVDAAGEEAFFSADGGMSQDVVGSIALYHSMSGLRATQALIAKAMGDIPTQLEAIAAFGEAISFPCENIDLALGSSGVLLGCALLLDAFPRQESLRDFGEAFFGDIQAAIDAKGRIGDDESLRFTGIAHGWAGVLYALLSWCRSSGRPLPDCMQARLEQLADHAEPWGGGLRWQRILRPQGQQDPDDYWLSWCNGSGGMIHLWTLAHAATGQERFLDMATGAASHVVEGQDRANLICCGRPGQAYALLNIFKHTQDERWLGFARQLTEESLGLRAAADAPLSSFHYCLYKGPMGSALLSADMAAAPGNACMPMFEREGWQA